MDSRASSSRVQHSLEVPEQDSSLSSSLPVSPSDNAEEDPDIIDDLVPIVEVCPPENNNNHDDGKNHDIAYINDFGANSDANTSLSYAAALGAVVDAHDTTSDFSRLGDSDPFVPASPGVCSSADASVHTEPVENVNIVNKVDDLATNADVGDFDPHLTDASVISTNNIFEIVQECQIPDDRVLDGAMVTDRREVMGDSEAWQGVVLLVDLTRAVRSVESQLANNT